jgi:hypothetical protein
MFIVYYICYPDIKRVHRAEIEGVNEVACQSSALAHFAETMRHCRTEDQLRKEIRPLYIETISDSGPEYNCVHEIHTDSDGCWDIVQHS